MKLITTNVTKMRELLADVTPEMHPGDYRDTLVNMVYYALGEAERVGRLLNDNSTLIDMVREIESVASTHVPHGNRLN